MSDLKKCDRCGTVGPPEDFGSVHIIAEAIGREHRQDWQGDFCLRCRNEYFRSLRREPPPVPAATLRPEVDLGTGGPGDS